ncbi:MAG: NAD(P)/FAD-dependent oxidoreductase [Abditibacteriota bacterium]|nr:NAD(P)/FAD-dependent oxidoreductase [Abditibacteriota bacterium]
MNYDVIVIGSGLGGMLTAASLSKTKKVLVLEQYNRIGGRFSSYDIEGYKVPTGAFHTIPYGANGALGKLAQSLGINRIKSFPGICLYSYKGRFYGLNHAQDLMSLFNFMEFGTMTKLIGEKVSLMDPNITMDAYLKKGYITDKTYSFFNSFSGFSMGLLLDQISAKEYISVIQTMARFHNPGYVEGGCGAFMEDLKNIILGNGGEIKTEEKVTEIISLEGVLKGVRGNEDYFADKIVYNGNPNYLNEICNNAVDLKEPLKPSCGVAMHFGSDEPIYKWSGIMICIGTKYIPGVVCQSVYDKTLAPEGKYLCSTCFASSGNLKEDMKNAKEELAEIFGREKVDKLKLLRVCNYTERWPANYAAQGTDIDVTTNYPNLYLVGDGCKESGYIMVEGVARSVSRVLEKI